MSEGHRRWVETLAASHDNLVRVLDGAGAVTSPSYCGDWTIAQVLSHLGSGAEIGMLNLHAALDGAPAPERERYVEIWDTWNAKSPEDQAADAVASDASYVATLSGLSDDALDALSVPMMGRELDASGFVAMRLFEHAIHVWDIEVVAVASAGIFAPATELLIDRLADRIDRVARGPKPSATPSSLSCSTSDPYRAFEIVIDTEHVSIADGSRADGILELGAEALLRLATGRLDPAHTPADVVCSGAVDLDELRALFPGY